MTGILLKDKGHGSYMAFLSELPEVATEVQDEKEAAGKFLSALMDVLEVKNMISDEQKPINGGLDENDVIRVPFNLSLQP